MSEPLARQRPVLGDVREIRTGQAHAGQEDPLAELARLVGREDPFRDIFPARPQNGAAAPGRPSPVDREPIELRVQPQERPDYDSARRAHESDEDAEIEEPNGRTYGSAQASYESYRPDGISPAGGERQRDSLRFPALTSPREDYGDPRFDHIPAAVPHHEAPPLHADLWAEGVQEAPATDPGELAPIIDEGGTAEADQSRRRTLIVLLAVLALTGGGVAATFLARGGSHGSTQQASAPTILADSAPTKVQPPETANAATGGDGSTALLEKSASDNVANAKVVDGQEQPVDLNQLPKPAASATGADRLLVGTQAASTFPEPRKVKTILIRPDGSVVGETAEAAPNPAAIATPGVVMPSVAAVHSDTPAAATPVAKPATPKSATRASATPKAAPVPHVTAKPKPVETATAEPARDVAAPVAGTVSTGAYAVQLAAPTSEEEAKSTSARLQRKFADSLAGHTPSIRKADSGSKSVYRVRVSNLSQDDAKSLCAKLQAGGGSCFVVHN